MIDVFFNAEPDPTTPAGAVPVEFMFATAATASGSGSDTSLKLKFDGESSYSQKYYKTLGGVSIASASRVLVIKVSGSYIILGRVY